MKEVIQFIEGKLSDEEFEQISMEKPEIWSQLQALLDVQLQTGNNLLTDGDRLRLEANGNCVQYAALSFGINSISHALISHIVPRKVPTWVQEPDWPMGKNSPMEYIDRKKDGDLVQFRFRDVDTGEKKIVEQFY